MLDGAKVLTLYMLEIPNLPKSRLFKPYKRSKECTYIIYFACYIYTHGMIVLNVGGARPSKVLNFFEKADEHKGT